MAMTLPNGGRISGMLVYPKNWRHPQASLKKDWRITYRYYPPGGSGFKQVVLRANKFPDLGVRREAVKILMDNELQLLQQGMDPFTRQIHRLEHSPYQGSWGAVVRSIAEQLNVASTTRGDLGYRIEQCIRVAEQLGIAQRPVQEVTKRDLKSILMLSGNSADAFNRQRSYLMMVYKELGEYEVVPFNYLKDIAKRKVTRKLRDVLTAEERKIVNDHLAARHAPFHRFVNIFYHSGARVAELMRLTKQDVDLKGQRFKITQYKGRAYTEKWKVIKDVALPYWESVMREPGRLVFSKNLEGGDVEVDKIRPTRFWNELVKKELGIKKDLYALKHLHTKDVLDAGFEDEDAAEFNSHTSTAMVRSTYDVGREAREMKKIKHLKNTL